MGDITDLNTYKNSKSEPDPEFVKHDEYGRKLYTYGYEFTHDDGHKYGGHIIAYSLDDANAKMESIKKSGLIIGQIYGVVQA